MVDFKKTFDVLISHSESDTVLAARIAEACRRVGVEAMTDGDLLGAVDASEELWQALAESRALLTVLSPAGLTSLMAVEIGAARAWNKPIYGIVTDPSSIRPSAALAGVRLFPADGLQEVIGEIQSSGQQWTDSDRAALIKVYAKLETPADQLAADPGRLNELTKGFAAATGKAMTGERLLSELLRLRKQGKLLRIGRTGRRKSEVKPA